MDYLTITGRIKNYLKRQFNYRISFGLRNGKPLEADKKELMANIPVINEEVLELILQQMYEDGYIISDNGQTVIFTVPFVFD